MSHRNPSPIARSMNDARTAREAEAQKRIAAERLYLRQRRDHELGLVTDAELAEARDALLELIAVR